MMSPFLDIEKIGYFIHFCDQGKIEENIKSMHNNGFNVYVENVDDIHDQISLIDKILKSGNFPKDFGRNWDALIDALCDIESFNAGLDHCFIMKGSSVAWKKSPQIMGALVEAWQILSLTAKKYDLSIHLVMVL